MSSFMSLFTTKEIIIMASVILGLLVIVLIMTIWDMFSKGKNAEEYSDLDEEIVKNEDTVNDVVVKDIESETLIENIQEDPTSEPLIIDVEENTKEQVEIISTEEEAKLELSKMALELEVPKSFEDTLTSIEMMEEENAIISYQELVETTKEMNIVIADSGDEPISINEIYNQYDMKDESRDNLYNKEFISTPCISPVGEYENENLAEIQLENTANLEKLDKEIRKTNQFLNILNELKKNLE